MEDPSLGPFDPAQTQIHDFNPSDLNSPGANDHFMDGGLFWTGRMRPSGASFRGHGEAELRHDDYPIFDFVDVVGAILRPPGHSKDPASADVEINWKPTGVVTEIAGPRLSGNGAFAGTYYQTELELKWTATNHVTGYRFSTEGSSSSTVTSAFSARVRNGVFA